MSDYEPHFRWWVAEKRDIGWLCVRKTRWGWYARHLARKGSRKGYRMKVEDKGGAR